MSIEELETEALKLYPKTRARSAGKLLQRLDNLSEAENARLWAEEAQRCDADMDANPDSRCAAEEVFRDARAKLR